MDMEYLVEIAIQLPRGLDEVGRAALVLAERRRGSELVRDGHIRAIWRVDGPGIRNAGIWQADDRQALDAAIASLPMAAWMTATITPLHPHPLSQLMDEMEKTP